MITDEDFAAALRALVDAVAPAVTADPAPIARRGRRRVRAVRWAGAAAVAVVALVVAAGLGGWFPRPAPPVTDPPRLVTTPPPEPVADARLWLSAERVPPGGVELVAVGVEQAEGAFGAGVLASVDRWDGDSWEPHRDLTMCQDHWYCTSELQPAGSITGSVDLGVGPATVQRFSTAGLGVGWYRVSQGGATGVLEVAEGADPPAPLWPVDEPSISVARPLLPPSGEVVLLSPLVPPVDGFSSADAVREATDELGTVVTVERWEDGAWARVAELQAELRDPADTNEGVVLQVPALDPGEYRVVRSGADGVQTGRFWVDAEIPPAPEPEGCEEATVCAFNAWIDVLVERAGWTGRGGDHDYRSGSEVVDLGDGRTVLVEAYVDDPARRALTAGGTARTVAVGLVTVEHGVGEAGTPVSEFSCATSRFRVTGSDDPATVAAAAETLASHVEYCFADTMEMYLVLVYEKRES